MRRRLLVTHQETVGGGGLGEVGALATEAAAVLPLPDELATPVTPPLLVAPPLLAAPASPLLPAPPVAEAEVEEETTVSVPFSAMNSS